MPKAEKEFLLNYAMNRWQLNFKRNVGPTSDSIRACNPKSFPEWEEYYYENVRSRAHLDDLGEKLFNNISSILPTETRFHPELINSVSLRDCVDFIHLVVVKRTFDGYQRERGK